MPRVNRVKSARKAQGHCESCGTPIAAGDAYVWWKFRYGGKRRRCTKPECSPKPWDLTQSEILSTLYRLQYDANASVGEATSIDALHEIAEDVASQIRDDLVELLQEKVDNIVDGFGHETVVSEELQDRAYAFDEWAQEIEESVDRLTEEYAEEVDDAEAEAALEEAREALQDALDNCPE